MVEIAAPTRRNSSTRQSASGTSSRMSPIPAGMLVITPVTMATSTPWRPRVQPRQPPSASNKLSVNSCRTMRRRVAPSDSRMPISRWRCHRPGEQQVGHVGTANQEDQAEGEEEGCDDEHGLEWLRDGALLRGEHDVRGVAMSLATVGWLRSQMASSARARFRDMPGFRRPMMSTPTSASWPRCVRQHVADGRERRPVVRRADAQAAEAFRHHADDLECDVVDPHSGDRGSPGRARRADPIHGG